MHTTSQQALESAVREDTISRNLMNLALDYAKRGNYDRASLLTYLGQRRHGSMLDDMGDAERLESEGK